ncbi:hypothetical protein CCYS_04080 [Corynebacterium cystitidis DSM 20524]|nr:hypothetical protein CCYS_04080 [Corynebacterium cystitidis DSM 20524]
MGLGEIGPNYTTRVHQMVIRSLKNAGRVGKLSPLCLNYKQPPSQSSR